MREESPMARQPGEFEVFSPNTGEKIVIVADQRHRELILLGFAKIIAPDITDLRMLDDPELVAQKVAEDVGVQHGIDVERARRCVLRLMSPRPGSLPMRGEILIDAFMNGSSSMLRGALDCMPPEDALRFCEEEDIERLPSRSFMTEVFADLRTPLYTLDELEQLIARFIEHQEANQASLLETGHPQTAFAPSVWLDVFLNKLYFTKLPVSIDPGGSAEPYQRFASLTPHPRYVDWRRISTTYATFRSRWAIGRLEDNELFECDEPDPKCSFAWGRILHGNAATCTFEEADALDRLSRDQIAQVEQLRPKLANLKREILARLHQGICSRNSDGLSDICLDLLAKRLNADEAKLLLDIDLVYGGSNACSRPVAPEVLPLIPGGLSNLIEIIGFIEKEMTIGSMSRVRSILGDLATCDVMGRRSFLGSSRQFPYAWVVGQGRGAQMREAADLYCRLETKEGVFWSDFRLRVEHAIANEFKIPLGIYVPAKLESAIRERVGAQVEQMIAELCTDARALPGSDRVPTKPANIFRREHRNGPWKIQFAEQPAFFMEDCKGLFYIHFLVTHPKITIHVAELAEAHHRYAAEASGSPITRGRQDFKAFEIGLSESRRWQDGDDVHDKIAREEIYAELEITEQQLDDLSRENPEMFDEIEELRKKRDDLKKSKLEAHRIDGTPKTLGSTNDKSRKAVSNAIRRAIGRMKKHSPHAAAHFRHIRTGIKCSYFPDPPLTWNE